MKKTFMTGLAILLPLAFTFFIVKFVVDFLTMPFMGVGQELLKQFPFLQNGIFLLSREQTLLYGTRVFILLFLCILVFLLGLLGRWFFTKSLLQIGEFFLEKIPLVNKIYRTSREVFSTIFSSQGDSFKEVVLVPFPSSEGRTLGFISGRAPASCEKLMEEEMVNVFVPTTPNPTSGFLMMFRRSQLQSVPMKVDEAIRFIISCGVLQEKEAKKLFSKGGRNGS